jgi:hypothetical protein
MLALLSGLFAQLFTTSTAWFLALKVVLGFLFITVLPIILNNFFKSVLDGMMALIAGQTGSVAGLGVAFTGLAGWGLAELGVPGAFAVVFAAIAFKVTLRLIPFVRL